MSRTSVPGNLVVFTPMNSHSILYIIIYSCEMRKNINNKGITNYPNKYPQGNIVQELKMFIRFTIT